MHTNLHNLHDIPVRRLVKSSETVLFSPHSLWTSSWTTHSSYQSPLRILIPWSHITRLHGQGLLAAVPLAFLLPFLALGIILKSLGLCRKHFTINNYVPGPHPYCDLKTALLWSSFRHAFWPFVLSITLFGALPTAGGEPLPLSLHVSPLCLWPTVWSWDYFYGCGRASFRSISCLAFGHHH